MYDMQAKMNINSKIPPKYSKIFELIIPGYSIYDNLELKGEHGVNLCVFSELSVFELHISYVYKESVFIKVKFNNNIFITLGNIYRSLSSDIVEDNKLFWSSHDFVYNITYHNINDNYGQSQRLLSPHHNSKLIV